MYLVNNGTEKQNAMDAKTPDKYDKSRALAPSLLNLSIDAYKQVCFGLPAVKSFVKYIKGTEHNPAQSSAQYFLSSYDKNA